MKQIFQNFKTGKLEVAEIPVPAARSGFILVRNYYSLISPGTERATIELAKKNLIEKARSRPDQVKQVINKIKTEGIVGTFQKVWKKLDEPLPLGYSSAGVVSGVGENVEGFSVGDRVACAGAGYACHAEVIAVPKNLCVKIPENVSFKEAAFVTLGAIALQGIRRANLTAGERVAVIGLGLIGQLTCQMLKAYGFPVLGVDVDPKQAKRAMQQGIDWAGTPDQAEGMVKSFAAGEGVDVVIITAATKSNAPIELAGRILRDRGRVSAVGDIKMDVPRSLYYKKELDLFISRSYGPGRYDKKYEEGGQDYPFGYVRWTEKRNMEEFLRMIDKKLIQPEKLITHIFKIEEAQQAYNLILENPNKEEIVAPLFSYEPRKKQKDTIFFGKKEYKKKDLVNVGLIGAGNFAQSTVLPSLKKIENIRLKAVADVQGISAQRMIKQFDGEYSTTNWQKIIQDKEIDLVIITTRHNFHAQMVIEALKNNKNVHVEKPLCLTREELKEIIKTAQKSEGRLMVGFNRRFAPLALKTKDLFSNNQPLMILCRASAGFVPKDHWVHDLKEGGGRIVGETCHFIDLCHYFVGSPPEKIYASLVPVKDSIETEDNVAITIDFKNGARGVVLYTSLGAETMPKEYIEVFGPGKAVVIDNFRSGTVFAQGNKKQIRQFSQDKGHQEEFRGFIEAIRRGEPSLIPPEEIFLSSLASLEAIRSLKERKIIDIDINNL